MGRFVPESSCYSVVFVSLHTYSNIFTCFIENRPSREIPKVMSKSTLFLATYLGLDSLALPVLAHSRFCLLLLSISDEDSLPEITLSYASTLASTLYSLVNESISVLYT